MKKINYLYGKFTFHKFVPVNKIINEDCVIGMKKLPDACIDLVVTSPPYDAIRDYKGFDVNLHETEKL